MISLFRRLSHRCSPILASTPVTNKVPIFPRLREELLAAKFPLGGLMMSSSSAAEEKPDFLRDVVALEELDTDLYISHSSWKALSARAMFGGQIIVQALAAGNRTVMPGLNLHSLHCYFLRPGDVSRSTVYRVNRTRDGTSFSSRSISAIQKGRPILTLQASYHNEDAEATSGILQYQPPMPVVKHHSELKNTVEYVKDFIKRPDLNEKRRARLVQSIVNDLPVEIKPLDPDAYMRQKPNDENKLTSWIRITGDLGEANFILCGAVNLGFRSQCFLFCKFCWVGLQIDLLRE